MVRGWFMGCSVWNEDGISCHHSPGPYRPNVPTLEYVAWHNPSSRQRCKFAANGGQNSCCSIFLATLTYHRRGLQNLSAFFWCFFFPPPSVGWKLAIFGWAMWADSHAIGIHGPLKRRRKSSCLCGVKRSWRSVHSHLCWSVTWFNYS